MIFAGSNKKDTRIALSVAIFLNLLILLLAFLFLRWTVETPPPADRMVELTMADFGYTNQGANATDGVTQTQTIVEEAPTEEAVVDDNSTVTQNVQDTPSEATQPSQTQTQTETQPQTQQVSSDLNNLLNNMNGGGDGNDGQDGDEGSENGKIDGNGVFGDGSGWSLANRTMTGQPRFNGAPTKPGVVQVKIRVDQNGNVKSANVITSPPTNTSDQSLYNLALTAARTAKFNADSNAGAQQNGTITFVFKVN